MTSRDPEKSKLVTPIRLQGNISRTAADTTITNYYIVCFEAVWSAILDMTVFSSCQKCPKCLFSDAVVVLATAKLGLTEVITDRN